MHVYATVRMPANCHRAAALAATFPSALATAALAAATLAAALAAATQPAAAITSAPPTGQWTVAATAITSAALASALTDQFHHERHMHHASEHDRHVQRVRRDLAGVERCGRWLLARHHVQRFRLCTARLLLLRAQ